MSEIYEVIVRDKLANWPEVITLDIELAKEISFLLQREGYYTRIVTRNLDVPVTVRLGTFPWIVDKDNYLYKKGIL